MVNFARFIPGTPDADYMRQQVSERGILEKIDAVNEVIKRGLGENESISDFYKMIADIEDNLNRNMNDPRAKRMVNTFDEAPKAEMKKETPKQETPEVPEIPETPGTTDPNEGVDEGVDAGVDAGTVDPAENTGVTDPAEGDETINADNTGITDNPVSEGVSEGTQETEGISEGISEGVQESTGPDTTEPEPTEPTEPETKQPTRRGGKKSEDAE